MNKDYFHIQLRSPINMLIPLESTGGVVTLKREEICPIPGVAISLLGVANQRGRLLWVVELSQLLGLTQSQRPLPLPDKLSLLVLSKGEQTAERRLGCIVSALKGVVSLPSTKFQPVPTKVSPILRSFLSGVTKLDNTPAAQLNVDAIFAALHS